MNGMQGTWGGGQRIVYDKDGSIYYTAHLEPSGLYVVNPLTLSIDHADYVDSSHYCNVSKSDAADLVHKQWGHLAQPRIERNIASGHIPWTHDSSATKFTHCTEPCVVC